MWYNNNDAVGYLKPNSPMEVPHFVVAKGQMQPSYICMAGSVKSLTVKRVSSVNTFPKGETNYQAIDYCRKTMPILPWKRIERQLFANSQPSVMCCWPLVYRQPVGKRRNGRPRVADRRWPTVYTRLFPLPMVQVNTRLLKNYWPFLGS